MNNIIRKKFSEIDLHDPFFDSLKRDYPGFDDWFGRKKDEPAFAQYENANLIGLLYLKMEYQCVNDVEPNIHAERILKVGTFKIEAHGTKMGEQFIKIIMDYAINEAVDVCYVTIYEKHSSLISLVQKFGFEQYGVKGEGAQRKRLLKENGNNYRGNKQRLSLCRCEHSKEVFTKYLSEISFDHVSGFDINDRE